MQGVRYEANQYIVDPPQSQYFDFNQMHVPSLYVVLPGEGWKVTVGEEEAKDKEILSFLEKSGHFNFLNNPEEEIYGLGDGEPV